MDVQDFDAETRLAPAPLPAACSRPGRPGRHRRALKFANQGAIVVVATAERLRIENNVSMPASRALQSGGVLTIRNDHADRSVERPSVDRIDDRLQIRAAARDQHRKTAGRS